MDQSSQLQEQNNSNRFDASLPLRHGCPDNWCWNAVDKSHEVRLYGPQLRVAHFHPNWSNGTAAVRGTRALNGGRYYWEINVSQRVFGTSMMFGIGTTDARLHADSFINMVGEDDSGWGLSHKGLACHAGTVRQFTEPFLENKATTMALYFDGVQGTLTYYKDGVCLGVAFRDLHLVEKNIYPMISSTAAKTEMTLVTAMREYVNLQDRCRQTVIDMLVNSGMSVSVLPALPTAIRVYILDEMTSAMFKDKTDEEKYSFVSQRRSTNGRSRRALASSCPYL